MILFLFDFGVQKYTKIPIPQNNFPNRKIVCTFANGNQQTNQKIAIMLQDIFDRDGKVIAQVETVRMETKYGDGCGHVVETVVRDDLSLSDFRDLDLRNADFHGMDLSQAVFLGADLRNADFRDATLIYTNFYDSNLEGADFRGADMRHALFDFWQKEDMIYDSSTQFPKHREMRPSYL